MAGELQDHNFTLPKSRLKVSDRPQGRARKDRPVPTQTSHRLIDILVKMDKMAMANSLEVRSPSWITG